MTERLESHQQRERFKVRRMNENVRKSLKRSDICPSAFKDRIQNKELLKRRQTQNEVGRERRPCWHKNEKQELLCLFPQEGILNCLSTAEGLIMMKQDIKVTDASLQSQSKDVENALLALKWGKRAKNSLKEFYCERYQKKKKCSSNQR